MPHPKAETSASTGGAGTLIAVVGTWMWSRFWSADVILDQHPVSSSASVEAIPHLMLGRDAGYPGWGSYLYVR